MAKKIVAVIKLALQAGKANPAPPVGPALGQHGVNIMAFCKEYNARTQDKAGFVIPVEISVFEDRSFTFITKTPPASVLITKAAGTVSYTHLRAHETPEHLVCRLLLEKKNIWFDSRKLIGYINIPIE